MNNNPLAKAINTLTGIITGITADGKITSDEINELSTWCILNDSVSEIYPFNEMIEVIQKAYSDGVLTDEEKRTVLNHCDYLSREIDSQDCDLKTAKTHELQGMLYGILADDFISDGEIATLQKWFTDNETMCSDYPFNEIRKILASAINDGDVTDGQRQALATLLASFVDMEETLNF